MNQQVRNNPQVSLKIVIDIFAVFDVVVIVVAVVVV
jgi:hypothetical protein